MTERMRVVRSGAEVGRVPLGSQVAAVGEATTTGHHRTGDLGQREAPDTRHVLDPERDDFYDYTLREYFSHPRDDGSAWVEGPYVDHGGVDDYVLTFSAPVSSGGRFVGVTAADVLVAELERHLAPWLAASSAPRMVINLERRVIVSNSATNIVGDVVPADAALDVLPIGVSGWCVATPTGW